MSGSRNPNDPRCLSAAVAETIDAIGYHRAEQAVGRSKSLLEKWRNPECQSLPDFDQCIALDAAYEAITKGRGLIISLYADRLAHLEMADGDAAHDPNMALLDVGIATGRLMEQVRSALHPTGPGGMKVTAWEKADAMKAISFLRRTASKLEEAIEAAASAGR